MRDYMGSTNTLTSETSHQEKKNNYQFMITLLLSRFVLIGALTFGSDRDKNAEGLIAIKLVLCIVGGCGI